MIKIINQKDPASPRIVDPLQRITKANVAEFSKNWEKWAPKK